MIFDRSRKMFSWLVDWLYYSDCISVYFVYQTQQTASRCNFKPKNNVGG